MKKGTEGEEEPEKIEETKDEKGNKRDNLEDKNRERGITR